MVISSRDYESVRERTVTGRYVTGEQLMPFFTRGVTSFSVELAGHSVKGRPVNTVTMGRGKKRVLIWSQMHGNESTCTKALLDLLNYFSMNTPGIRDILEVCTMRIIPVLNPDGAAVYSRENANSIDLNRDAIDLSQPESRILRDAYRDFAPAYCFNMHDQRTIYSAGKRACPASVSFLAPAHDKERSVSMARAESMALIAGMNKVLQELIPQQVGRYDDAFNPQCVGDTFQSLGTPTILFEAGHFQGDYQREKSREFIFQALAAAFRMIAGKESAEYGPADYEAIPQNAPLFFDVLIRNAQRINAQRGEEFSAGIQYREELSDKGIRFVPEIAEKGELKGYFGHVTFDTLLSDDLRKLAEHKEIKALFV